MYDSKNYEECQPRADAMIYSLRAFGYNLSMAIADLIDNSIFAEAKNIFISYSWNNGDPWVSILDDGKGMNESELVNAMRPGSQSPREERDGNDLGRFGLGLKTASFSQCKKMYVASRKSGKKIVTRFWDLDHVEKVRKWELGKIPPKEIMSQLKILEDNDSGTIVLWKDLDRVVDFGEGQGYKPEEAFLESFLDVKKRLEMVFHEFLKGSRPKIIIKVGRAKCEAWDPYLKKNAFTQELHKEKHEDSKVKVIPYVLPHVSKRTVEESNNGSGIKGWNAHQGFYVYRNGRMIVSGGYLDYDLKPEEHYKLTRVKIDIGNEMDHEWGIDVRKAVASPPDRLKNELLRIIKATRQKALEVYEARTGSKGKHGKTEDLNNVWSRKKNKDKISYKINRKHQVIEKLLNESGVRKNIINKLFHVIETTVPYRFIILDGSQNEDCYSSSIDISEKPPSSMVEICLELYKQKIASGIKKEDAIDIVCSIEPFNINLGYRAFLDDYKI